MTWLARRSRAALGLAPVAIPVSLYIPLGVLLGPHALNVLSESVLAHLDAAISVTLAAVGTFVGIAFASQGRAVRRVLAAALIESGITIALVTLALGLLLSKWALPSAPTPWLVALVLGTCAAASAASVADAGAPPSDRLALRVADLDDVLPIVVGAVALGLARPQPFPAAGQIGLTLGLGLVAGVIGWLLFERAGGPGERGVFVLGTLVFIGGAAAYLNLSPLLAGVVCGAFWRVAPGRADAIVAEDLRRYHHPLVLLLMTCAGADMAPRLTAVWLFAPFVLFRLTGKLMGGLTATLLEPSMAAGTLGTHLLPPGVVGVALALNFHQVGGDLGALVVTAVAAAAVVFELAAAVVAERA